MSSWRPTDPTRWLYEPGDEMSHYFATAAAIAACGKVAGPDRRVSPDITIVPRCSCCQGRLNPVTAADIAHVPDLDEMRRLRPGLFRLVPGEKGGK